MTTPSPSWISVLQLLHRLPPEAPVTVDAFRQADPADGERLWKWALAQRGFGTRYANQRGASPWAIFVQGESASAIRNCLPRWISDPNLRVAPASDLYGEALRCRAIKARLELGRAIGEHLKGSPEDIPYLRGLLDAFETTDESSAHSELRRLINRAPIPASHPLPTSGASASSRPTLKRRPP